MSTGTFGEVQYDEAPQGQAEGHPVNGAAPQQEVIALDDPRLLGSENIETNPTGDAYAPPPLLPDGKWRAKLTLVKIKDAAGIEGDYRTAMATWRNPQVPFFCVNIQSEVIDHSGKFDGVKLTEYWVKTLIGDRGPGQGTSQLATIVRASGGALPANLNQKQVLDFSMKHLAGEPEVVIETVWEAACEKCEKEVKAAKQAGNKISYRPTTGMHRFPQKAAGVFSPDIECSRCKSQLRAQARIVQYFPVSTPHQGVGTAKK